MRDRILINKELVPYRFEFSFGDKLFTVEVNYNRLADFFTLALYDTEGNTISRGEKLVYNMPLWADIYDCRYFPCLTIRPVDQSNNTEVITWNNFNERVFLEIFDEVEE